MVLFTAPTGKAAKLLGRKAGTDGYTLHQIMYSYRAHLKHNPDKIWKFSSVEVLIVDECSMVAVEIFASLLKVLLENTDLKRVVFLGDVRQLPSVQPGNFLQDIFSTFLLNPACSIELKTNHRAESELIIQNATRISQRKLPEFDDKRNYKFHPVVANEGCQYESFEQGTYVYTCIVQNSYIVIAVQEYSPYPYVHPSVCPELLCALKDMDEFYMYYVLHVNV